MVFTIICDINEIWTRWKQQFFLEVESFIPCLLRTSQDRPRQPPWFNRSIGQLIRTKNRLFNRARSSGLPDHWEKYKAARNKATNHIRMAKSRNYFQIANTLANTTCPPSKWWNLVRSMCGLKGHASNVIPPLSSKTNVLVHDDKQKAEVLNDTFINQNTSTALHGFPFGPTETDSICNLQHITASKVRRVLSSLPSKSSTGTDGISYRLLKEAGPALVGPLTTLFNISLRLSQVPDEWKRSVISPLLKGGNRDRQEAKNYRPISLTSCVARVMEKLLNEQILNYLQDQSLICNEQAGFLPGQSTVTQLCFLINRWQVAIDRGEGVEAIFLDLSKAYDRVSIPGLIYKLSRVGFSQAALKWFSSFLTDRQQRVRVHGSESSWETVKSGIPQGTVLGPTLFLLYINDLPQSLLNECALFADDTTAYGVGKLSKTISSSLSSDMDSAADWAKTWGMLFNAEKSEHLSIRQISSSPSPSDSHVIMGGIQIPKVTEHKHLGITIQSSLKWSRHICNVYTACARRVGILRRLKRKLQPSTILKIYTGTVRPIMEYACAIWSGGPTAKLKKLQRSFCRSHGVSLPPLQTRFDYFTLMLFYKIRMRLSPQSLQNMLPNPSSHSGYQFRKLSYPVPKVKKSSTLASFFPRAIILWNDLPANLHSINTLSKFKSELRKHLKLQ